MSDRTRNGKPLAQDLTGVALCVLGGFFAVSIVLAALGQEPRVGVVTAPVVELVSWLGTPSALLLALGLAALGALLFLRAGVMGAGRPLAALASACAGLGFLLGAFGHGGALGAVFPGLVAGFAGKGIGLALGLALGWVGWTLLPRGPERRTSRAEALQRIALSARHDSAAGVSAAEAALLVTEPRPASRPMPRSAESAPGRQETLRPFSPAGETPAAEPRAKRAEPAAPPAPARPPEPAPLRPAASAQSAAAIPVEAPPRAASAAPAAVSAPVPPTPSWEGRADLAPDDEQAIDEQEEDEALALAQDLAQEFEVEDIDEEQLEAEETASAPQGPGAAWEQIGLFDEEVEEEAPTSRTAKVELTPAFDFEAGEPKKPAHEPETCADPFAAQTVATPSGQVAARGDRGSAEEGGIDPADAPTEPRPAPAPEFVLEPRAAPAPKPEPKVARDEDGERWHKLVFDAGCAILDQNRVAVSMLERRFGIDFDQACRVLDELQEAGLIGPYMGGRTRDILLSREEWLAHAPHAS